MPASIVALVDHPLVFLGEMLSLRRDVGDVVDLDLALGLVLLREFLERSELLGECDHRAVVEPLVAKTEQMVLLECVPEHLHRVRIERLRCVETDDLGSERRGEAPDREVVLHGFGGGHGVPPVSVWAGAQGRG